MEVRTYRAEEDAAAVAALIAACRAAGDRDPLSEGKALAVGHRGRSVVMLVDGVPAAFAQLVEYTGHAHPPGYGRHSHPDAHWEGEFVVAPDRRSALSEAVAAATVAAGPDGVPLELWAAEPYQEEALRALGWVPVRSLHRMEVSPVPDGLVPPPAGFTVDRFVPGRDDEAFLRANHEIFAAHPEQSSWDSSTLQDRLSRPWFDAQGFLLARDRRGGVVGFCWTKVHAGNPAMGEIFLIGVVEAVRGTGLGRALTSAGLHHLATIPEVAGAMLYVDGANGGARTMYEGLGFRVAATKDVYRARS